jgi:hypothetical protein
MHIQTFISRLSLKALDEGILHRLAGADIVNTDAFLLCPGTECSAGKLRTIINGDPAREDPFRLYSLM